MENNILENEHKKLKNDAFIDPLKECLIRTKSQSSVEISTELGRQRSFDKGENDYLFSLKYKNKVVKLKQNSS